MKLISILLIALFSHCAYSQELNKDRLEKLETFGIVAIDFNYNNSQISQDFNLILNYDKRRRRTKRAGIVFASLGILSIVHGINVSDAAGGDGLGGSIGDMFIVGGSLSIGASIPLFITSLKTKKERDLLISKYQ